MEVRILSSEEDHQVFGEEYCSGYVDQYGKWNTGFSCPTKSNEEAVYCCGTPTYKYCCTRRSQAVTTHPNHPTRTQLDPRILLKIVGLTCIVSVFLTILTCYVCKRYWKRSDSRDNQVYRVSCNTSSSPHVFPLESLQPLNPNAFFKSPDHVANLCGDLALLTTSQAHPTQLRAVFASSRATPSALCSYQHTLNNNNSHNQSLLRQHRTHEPPPPYQLSVISGTANTNPNGNATGSDGSGGSGGAGNSASNSNVNVISDITANNETTSEQNCVSPESDCNSCALANTEVKIPLSMSSHSSEPQQSNAFDIHTHHQQRRVLRRMSQ